MKKIALLLALLVTGPAFAADNAVIVTPGTGVTMKSKDIGAGVQAMQPVISDTGGNALSTPTAGADGVSNTSTGLLSYGRNFVFNGTTWDRWLGDATNGGFVNVKTSVLPTGASTSANQSTEITALNSIITNTAAAIPAGSSIIGKVGIDQTTPGTTNGVQINTGTASIGNVGADPSSGKGTPASVAISVSTATTTQLVAISGSTKIYVTSFDVIAGGTGNITFEYGTGSTCGTGTTTLTGAYNLTAQAGIAKGNGLGAILVVPAGNALCVLTSAAVQMSGSVSYQQF
jgi:hypothetical protein